MSSLLASAASDEALPSALIGVGMVLFALAITLLAFWMTRSDE